ncbi:MAG: HAD hydrolase family protein [Opitutaceae bacterium]|nr:HAD hydrolase family protein [Opitutaceae bacterium]
MSSLPAKPPIAAARWARIKLFAMDVDGVLTDGTVLVSSDGSESKAFSVLDGLGLTRLRDHGVLLAWISGRASGASTKRAEELRIPHLIQGRHDKAVALKELVATLGVERDDFCYMGDDDIDVGAMLLAGIGISVPTGMPAALAAADYITTLPAGRGAVREVANLILQARGVIPPHTTAPAARP